VIEAQARGIEAADLDLVLDVTGAEHRRGEADESREHHQVDVEVVDEEKERSAPAAPEHVKPDASVTNDGQHVEEARRCG
jgi:hypothetical protein